MIYDVTQDSRLGVHHYPNVLRYRGPNEVQEEEKQHFGRRRSSLENEANQQPSEVNSLVVEGEGLND